MRLKKGTVESALVHLLHTGGLLARLNQRCLAPQHIHMVLPSCSFSLAVARVSRTTTEPLTVVEYKWLRALSYTNSSIAHCAASGGPVEARSDDPTIDESTTYFPAPGSRRLATRRRMRPPIISGAKVSSPVIYMHTREAEQSKRCITTPSATRKIQE